MGKFDGYLLVSDLDGTLIDHQARVSAENLAAIDFFVAEGGRFAGATGRTELNVGEFSQGMPLTAPWILYNGAAIYDWQNERFVYKAPLARAGAEAFVRRVMARLPRICVQIFAGGPYCQVNPTALPDRTALRERQAFVDAPLESVTGDWLKVLFCSDFGEELDVVEAMLEDDPLRAVVHKMRSGSRYFEFTASGVNKGSALARLRTLLDPAPCCVVAIGDYINDIEMLQEADVSAAPESALAQVKQHATIITACHTQSAVADLVRRLGAQPLKPASA